MEDFTPKTQQPPVEFKLYGREFHCAPMVSSTVVFGFIDLMEEQPPGEDGDQQQQQQAAIGQLKPLINAINKLFKAAIIDPEEYAAWEELRDSDTEVVDIGTLMNVGTFLAGKYTAGSMGERPTGEPSEGGSSKKSRGKGSTGGAQRGPLTYSRSEQTALTH